MKQILIILLLTLTSCSQSTNTQTKSTTEERQPTLEKATIVSYQDLDVKQFAEEIVSNSNAIIMDVRTPEETVDGIIDGAIELDYYDEEFLQKLSKMDKSKDYYVYCKMGGRSAKAARLMIKNGFSSVHNLKGGYIDWIEEKK